MEVIRIEGYTEDEKTRKLPEKHLLPKIETGNMVLRKVNSNIDDDSNSKQLFAGILVKLGFGILNVEIAKFST